MGRARSRLGSKQGGWRGGTAAQLCRFRARAVHTLGLGAVAAKGSHSLRRNKDQLGLACVEGEPQKRPRWLLVTQLLQQSPAPTFQLPFTELFAL